MNVRRVVYVGVACFLLCFGLYGIWQTGRNVYLEHRVQEQDKEIEILTSKLKTMESRIQEVEALHQELKQMLQGANEGISPQGGGASQRIVKKDVEENSFYLNRLQHMQVRLHQVKQHLLLDREALLDGGLEKIHALANSPLKQQHITSSDVPSIWPAKGYISSVFGYRKDPISGRMAIHEGIDIAGPYGSPIVAAADGKVLIASPVGEYGLMIALEHPSGVITRYGHASSLLVKEGEEVKQGQPIALIGSTGKSTGAHLHYEVLVQHAPVDPLLFLPKP